MLTQAQLNTDGTLRAPTSDEKKLARMAHDALQAAELISRPQWPWLTEQLRHDRAAYERAILVTSRDGRLDEIEAAFLKGRIAQIDRILEQTEGRAQAYARWQAHAAQKRLRQETQNGR